MLTPWYVRYGIEPPFPWLGVGLGLALGAVIVLPLAAWVVLGVVDCDLGA